jgi:hypothetical protein
MGVDPYKASIDNQDGTDFKNSSLTVSFSIPNCSKIRKRGGRVEKLEASLSDGPPARIDVDDRWPTIVQFNPCCLWATDADADTDSRYISIAEEDSEG